jgi:hypothetical protein
MTREWETRSRRDDGGVRRNRLTLLAGVLAAAGLVVAVVPFRIGIPVEGEAARTGCRPPVVSAWHSSEKVALQLWAVTIDTNMEGGPRHGYAIRGGAEPWCAAKARLRLAISVVLLGAALTAGMAARRPAR